MWYNPTVPQECISHEASHCTRFWGLASGESFLQPLALLTNMSSVLCPFLRVSFLVNTTTSFWTLFLTWQRGMLLHLFDLATIYLGGSTRKFQRTTCKYYRTTELPQEHTAHGRRTATLSAKKGRTAWITSSPKEKKLNLSTYKFHTLGDYPDTIRRFGTTDNYTTQLVCSFPHSLLVFTSYTRVSLNTVVSSSASCGQERRKNRWSRVLQIRKLLNDSFAWSTMCDRNSVEKTTHSFDVLALHLRTITPLPSPLVSVRIS